MMYYIIYLSTATHLFTEDDLQQILEVSRLNNEKRDISGMLLYHDGAILQVLEGDETIVTHLFEKLKTDTRHHSVFKVLDGQIEHRYFEQWSMAFKRLGSREWDKINGYLPANKKTLPLNGSSTANSGMLTFMRSFCEANFKDHQLL